MSYSVRLIIAEQKENAQGKAPVKICVTLNGQRIYHSTGKRVKLKDFDSERMVVRKSEPNHSPLNIYFRNQLQKIDTMLLKLEAEGTTLTPDFIRSTLHGRDNRNLTAYAEGLIKQWKQMRGKYADGTIRIQEAELKRLKRFKNVIYCSDVNQNFLRKYEIWLRSPAEGLSGNSVHRSWKFFRKIVNRAVREKLIPISPFPDYDNPKYEQTDRTYLTRDEVDAVEALLQKPIDESLRIVINYFLLGCYSSLRYSDWARFNYSGFVTGDRLVLRAKKNGEVVSIEIHKRLRAVLDRLKYHPPIFEEQVTNRYLKSIAKLAEINKNMTTHVARHSFAMRCAENDTDIEKTAALMGIGVKSCRYYYKITNRSLDKEMRKWDEPSAAAPAPVTDQVT